jgi:hypothetical protein
MVTDLMMRNAMSIRKIRPVSIDDHWAVLAPIEHDANIEFL